MTKTFHIAPKVIMDDIALVSGATLFGSRSMASRPAVERFDPAIMIGAQIDDSTDWDFSAPYTLENHTILLASGYIHWPVEQLGYRDEITEGVYIKTHPQKFDLSNIDIFSSAPTSNVVLRNDHALFCQVWNSIDPEFYYKHVWKRSPTYDEQDLSLTKGTIRDIMNQLFRTARHMI